MENKFYETKEGHKILDEIYWTDNLKQYLNLENKYLLNIEKKDSLLDIGCGKGRHLIFIKNKIKRLLGIDNSKSMVDEAKNLTKDFVNIKIDYSDINNFSSTEKFDYIICMFNTFGNMDKETQKIFLKRAKELLKQGGKIIISVYSENAKEDQIQFYKNIGLTIKGFNEDFVYTENEFISERFNEEKLRDIIRSVEGLKINKIISLNKISYIVEIII